MDESPELDGFVMAVSQKRRAAQLIRDHADLATFCPERKAASRFELPDSFCIMSEIGEATQAILDHKVCAIISKFENNIDYIHISDQYTGPKAQQDEGQPVKLPETKRALVFSFKGTHLRHTAVLYTDLLSSAMFLQWAAKEPPPPLTWRTCDHSSS